VKLHLALGTDRARNHGFLVHGHTWPMEEHLDSLRLTAGDPGDYVYRSGVLRWAVTEGLWDLIRVR
jgi:manganese oxidase